jgi:hypothetical protein
MLGHNEVKQQVQEEADDYIVALVVLVFKALHSRGLNAMTKRVTSVDCAAAPPVAAQGKGAAAAQGKAPRGPGTTREKGPMGVQGRMSKIQSVGTY